MQDYHQQAESYVAQAVRPAVAQLQMALASQPQLFGLEHDQAVELGGRLQGTVDMLPLTLSLDAMVNPEIEKHSTDEVERILDELNTALGQTVAPPDSPALQRQIAIANLIRGARDALSQDALDNNVLVPVAQKHGRL